MIETKVLQGDQMVMEIGVWEELAPSEALEHLERKGRFVLTLTFRVQLRAPDVVLITASSYHTTSRVNQEEQENPVFEQGATFKIVDLMLAEYKLDESDHSEVLDEIEDFLAEHMPHAVSLDKLLLAT